MAPKKRAAPKRTPNDKAAAPVVFTQEADGSLSPLSELGSSSPPTPSIPLPVDAAAPPTTEKDLESPYVALRNALTDSLQKALAELAQRRQQLVAPIPALTAGEIQAIIETVQQACGPNLKPAELDSDEPLWRKEARKGIVYTALEELVFDVAMNHTLADLATENINDSTPFALLVDVLDLVLAFSEQSYADPNLPLTCIASILDMQTISGCFHIFAYLESRFERLTADMHPSKGKGLILLRLLNDLLRRLPKSKNDDIIFCGRILLFLSSAFPVGEKSGVNLRGNFNLGKVIGFEEKPVVEEQQAMDVDEEAGEKKVAVVQDDFYTVFWSLQKYFINPQSLFSFPPSPADPPPVAPTSRSEATRASTDAARASSSSTAISSKPSSTVPTVSIAPPPSLPAEGFPSLRRGLAKTLEVFRDHTRKEREVTSSSSSNSNAYSSSSSSRSDRDKKKMSAFERGDIDAEQEFTEATQSYFFPKFLTSRNLLSLELADPAFRRQILVQALILFQYLLAFIPNGHLSGSSTVIPQKLGSVDEAWIKEMKVKVTMEMESMGGGGKFFRGTIELILRREQAWINWKLLACQPITKSPVDAVSTSATAKGKLATMVRKPKAWPYPLGNPTLSKLWEKNLTRLDGEIVVPEEPFDSLVRSWRITNRTINQRNTMLNNARASLAAKRTDVLVETEGDLVRELELLHNKAKVLHWRAIRMASTTYLHLCHLIKSGNLTLLLAAIEAERIKLAEKEEIIATQLAERLAAESVGELPDRGTPELEGPPEEEENLLVLEIDANASSREMTSRDHSRINTPLRKDESMPSSRAATPKPTLDDIASPAAKRNRDEMEVDSDLKAEEQESKRVKSDASGKIAEEKQEQEEVAAALGL